MFAKIILALSAQVFLVQMVLSQCTNRAAVEASAFGAPYGWPGSMAAPALGLAAPYAYNGLGWAGKASDGFYPTMDFTPTSGGGLPVTSISAISPTGISVVSDNAYEGLVTVIGEVPFLSAVAIEGVVPTAGAGSVYHACGNGITTMISEGVAPGIAGPAAYGQGPYGPAGFGAAGYGPASFGPAGYGAAAFAPSAAMAPGLGYAGCGCGRGML